MSQRSEKLHRQVSQLRADVAELKEHQLTTERFNNALQAVTEEGSTQQLLIERRKAREARETAQEWRRNAVLALILAALIAAVALVISAKAVATEGPTTPPTKVSTISDGRLSGDDTPAQEPLRLDQAHVLEDVTITHYDVCSKCCGKTDGMGIKSHTGRNPECWRRKRGLSLDGYISTMIRMSRKCLKRSFQI